MGNLQGMMNERLLAFTLSSIVAAFIVSLDASTARLLASNSGLFTEGQADFVVSRPASFAPPTRARKERPRNSRFSNRTTPALKEFGFC
jgi:hypothetical protein